MLIALVSILFTIAGKGISGVIVIRRFAIASTPLVSLWGEKNKCSWVEQTRTASLREVKPNKLLKMLGFVPQPNYTY
ncbi:hypothetical protein [Nostoc sp.]|uniref:hypothetical protein n=1 Tax=Nostoc sp. TaxID=1180 RepID=UPI002FF780FA